MILITITCSEQFQILLSLRLPTSVNALDILSLSIPTLTLVAMLIFRKRKKLTYRKRSYRVFSIEEEFSSDIEVVYKGRRVKELWLTKLALVNTGAKELCESDFIEPLGVNVGDVEVMSAELYSKAKTQSISIHNSKLYSDKSSNSVKLNIKLLNPKESLKLSILTQGEPQIAVEGHVKGVSTISEYKESRYDVFPTIAFIVIISIPVLLFETILRGASQMAILTVLVTSYALACYALYKLSMRKIRLYWD